jgi:hypothetical protein
MKMKSLLLITLTALGLTTSTMAQNLPNYLPSNGLVGWWPFNGNANDESGNGNNGTINGATLSTDRDGLINSSINETNDGSYIKTQSVITNAANTFSISLWANPSQDDIVIAQGVNGNEGYGTMSIIHPTHGENWGSTSLNAGVGINVGRNQIQVVEHSHLYIASPLVYSTQIQEWHHIVLVYDQHVPKLYLDGNLVSVGLQSSIQNVHPSSGFCSYYTQSGFGNSFTPNTFTTGNYKGDFDDIGIWNRALTQQEISDLYNSVNCSNNTTITPETNALATGSAATFSVTTSDPNPSYLWQSNFGQGYVTLNDFGNYSGTNTNTLSISNVQLANHNVPIRVISTSDECIDTSDVVTISILDTCVTSINDTTFITVTDTLVINTLITAINPPNNFNTIIVYPNPANSHITIDYGNYATMNGYQLQIENSLGQQLFQTNITQQSDYLSLNNWGGNGLYFVHIIDPEGNTTDIRKIVLQ